MRRKCLDEGGKTPGGDGEKSTTPRSKTAAVGLIVQINSAPLRNSR